MKLSYNLSPFQPMISSTDGIVEITLDNGNKIYIHEYDSGILMVEAKDGMIIEPQDATAILVTPYPEFGGSGKLDE